MKTIEFCLGFLLMLFSFAVYSQNLNDELTDNQKLAEAFLTSNTGFSPDESLENNRENNVFIQQVGSNHVAISNVASQISSLNFSQEGIGNYISLKAQVNSMTADILQNGDYNTIFKDIYDPASNGSIRLRQDGQNNHFESYGANSIGNSLKFIQTGDNKSIIVRNFQ